MSQTNGGPAGLINVNRRPVACGVCGEVLPASKTHVPPQTAGNSDEVERAHLMRGPQGIVPGRWERGGMWVRGLCGPCNADAGGRYDRAYAAFAGELRQRLVARFPISSTPPIEVAPGRVARSVLSGMLGISPNIRVMHRDVAEQVKSGGPVRLPGRLSLRLALYLGADAQLTGPMLTAFPLDARATVNTLASVTFNPFSWALSGIGDDDALGSAGWLDVTEWLLYEDDREAHDLRFLVPRGLPVTPAVLHQPSNQGMQMYSAEITPILLGRLPGYRPRI